MNKTDDLNPGWSRFRAKFIVGFVSNVGRVVTRKEPVMKGGWLALAALTGLMVPGGAMAADAPKLTFTKDIAPIFQAKCESCHRPDSMAPMSLRTYEEARPWVRSIAQRVSSRQMPPWHIDKTIGIQQFKNDRSLSDE